MERVSVYLDRKDPKPADFKAYMAEVFASLDENPRRLLLSIDARNDNGAEASIDLVEGEPVFRVFGRRSAHANFRGRWLAEHPVPFVLKKGRAKLVLEPTTANRVRVRSLTLFERIFK